MNIQLLEKYNMTSLEGYKEMFGDSIDTEKTFYETFLIQTDYIASKLIESQILGIECKDYSEELAARQYAREQINLLKNK